MRTLNKTIILSACVGIMIFSMACRKHILPAGVPTKIKYVSISSIYSHTLPDGTSPINGVAKKDVVYEVTDAIPAWYKIGLPSGKRGWIYANVEEKWTMLVDENQVRILKNGISVREKPYDLTGPEVGVVVQDYIFDILDTVYSYYKIILPNGKEGWVYGGKPEDKWIKPVY